MCSLNQEDSFNEYDNEPVVYCASCLSLKIRIMDGTDFCDDCGCTEMKEDNIFNWEKEYESRYGKKFLDE